jgi:hypothetical protein
MARDRLWKIVLVALGLVLAFTLYHGWSDPSAVPLLSSNGSTGPFAGSTRRLPQPAVAAPDVHLKELDMERPTPALADRNLFRFKPKPLPAPPPPLRRRQLFRRRRRTSRGARHSRRRFL